MFIETITFFGNSALIPIDRIKHIHTTYSDDSYKLVITSDEQVEHVECFKTDDDLCVRYDELKLMLAGSRA